MKKLSVVLISLYGVENGGVRVLAAALKKEGHAVTTVFFKNWRNNNVLPPTERETGLLLELLAEKKPAIVGLGFGTPYYRIAVELSARIRKAVPSLIVWGGIHATVMPEDCITTADVVCVGEGEGPLTDLAARLAEGRQFDDIANLWVRTKDGVRRNALRPLAEKLDELPFRDFENEGKYFIEDGRLRRGDPALAIAEFRVSASRGCPFACAYCYNSVLRSVYEGGGRYYRTRSVENVLAEIEYARARFGRIRRVKFDDDTFTGDRAWVDEFCEKYPRRIGIPFDIMLAPQLINEELLRKLKGAGLVRVQVGIESPSDSGTAKLYARSSTNEQITAFARLNERLKIDVVYDIILDNPLSTGEEKERLLEFLLRLPRPFKLFLYSLVYFPKTAITEDFLRRGIITPDDVEGAASKSFRQFRLSFDYPRPAEDVFFSSLIVLVSKSFIPRSLVRILSKSRYLRRRPSALRYFSEACNLLQMSFVGAGMLLRGEITPLKLKEYANLRKMITQ